MQISDVIEGRARLLCVVLGNFCAEKTLLVLPTLNYAVILGCTSNDSFSDPTCSHTRFDFYPRTVILQETPSIVSFFCPPFCRFAFPRDKAFVATGIC